MAAETSKLTRKCQATIPAGIRKHLGLRAGDRLAFEVRHGEVLLRKARAIDRALAAALSGTLTEWNSDEDERAFRHL